jgi:hypothetical protein
VVRWVGVISLDVTGRDALQSRVLRSARCEHPTDSNPYVARHIGAELGSDGGRVSLHLPSARHSAARDVAKRVGHRGTAEAAASLFVRVTSDNRDQVGTGGDPRGDGGATCKIAGIAYTDSNPVPATAALTSNNAVVGR